MTLAASLIAAATLLTAQSEDLALVVAKYNAILDQRRTWQVTGLSAVEQKEACGLRLAWVVKYGVHSFTFSRMQCRRHPS